MSLELLTTSFPWGRYSKKLAAKIDNPRHAGIFTKEDAESRHMRLAEGTDGRLEDGNIVRLYWLVDPDDAIIVDAKFQVLGQSALIGAAEAACELIVGKNYDQARRVSVELLDKQVRDRAEQPAFPKETHPHLNLVLGALDNAAEQCMDIPLPERYVAPPVPTEMGEVRPGGFPGWKELPLKKKLAVIEDTLDNDIRPYIALDGGGIVVLNLIQDREVVISYQGNCTSCYSSIGTTLSYIQQVLKAKVHPDIIVVPDIQFPPG